MKDKLLNARISQAEMEALDWEAQRTKKKRSAALREQLQRLVRAKKYEDERLKREAV